MGSTRSRSRGFFVIGLKIVEHSARIKEFDDALAEASVKIVGLTERVAQLDGNNKGLASVITDRQLAFRDEYAEAFFKRKKVDSGRS